MARCPIHIYFLYPCINAKLCHSHHKKTKRRERDEVREEGEEREGKGKSEKQRKREGEEEKGREKGRKGVREGRERQCFFTGVISATRGWSLVRETLYWSWLNSLATLSITTAANSSLETEDKESETVRQRGNREEG